MSLFRALVLGGVLWCIGGGADVFAEQGCDSRLKECEQARKEMQESSCAQVDLEYDHQRQVLADKIDGYADEVEALSKAIDGLKAREGQKAENEVSPLLDKLETERRTKVDQLKRAGADLDKHEADHKHTCTPRYAFQFLISQAAARGSVRISTLEVAARFRLTPGSALELAVGGGWHTRESDTEPIFLGAMRVRFGRGKSGNVFVGAGWQQHELKTFNAFDVQVGYSLSYARTPHQPGWRNALPDVRLFMGPHIDLSAPENRNGTAFLFGIALGMGVSTGN